MTVVSGTTQTYQQIGRRESLSDKIYDISPEETPFLSSVRKGPKADATYVEWQTDALAAANGANKTIEGDDATYNTASPTVRIGNYTQILDKAIVVSDTAQMVMTAGRKRELAYQASKRVRELKRDLETSLTNNYASDDGSASTARALGSIESWLTTNPSRGSGGATAGADGGFRSTTKQTVAATDASSSGQRAFTETLLKAQVRAIWTAGGQPTVCMVGPVNKQRASGFAGIADLRRETKGAKPASVAIVGAADIYQSDFGELTMVPSRFSRERTALFLDMDYWSVRFLEDWTTVPLARTGHAEKKLIKCEVTLECHNEASSGAVADLTTT